MTKDDVIYWVLGIIAIVVIAIFGPQMGLFSVFEEEAGYIPYTLDDKIFGDIPQCPSEDVCWELDVEGSYIIQLISYINRNDCSGTEEVSITPEIDLSKKNFKVDYDCIGTAHRDTGGKVYCAILGEEIVVNMAEGGSGVARGSLEIVPSVLNSSISSIYFNGIYIKTVISSDINNLLTRASARTSITDPHGYDMSPCGLSVTLKLINPRYKPIFSCNVGSNDLLAMESFTGGQELGIYSMRYPVQSFCLDQPVIITSPEGATSTAEPYNVWVEGGTLSVPSDQTWTVFYVMQNDGSIPIICSDEYYDVDLQRCTDTAVGIIQICSEGQFDSNLGLCVVQPESACAEGYFDTELGLCVYHPPIQYICPQGTYSEQSGKCEYEPGTSEVCPTDYIWNPISEFCEFVPETQIICPTDMAYSADLNKCVGEGIIAEPLTAEEMCNDLDGDWDGEKCVFEESKENWCIQMGMDYDLASGKCTYIEEIVPEVISDEIKDTEQPVWLYVLVIGLIVLYLVFEAGPNKGFIKR